MQEEKILRAHFLVYIRLPYEFDCVMTHDPLESCLYYAIHRCDHDSLVEFVFSFRILSIILV
jgi:hypothetical protein